MVADYLPDPAVQLLKWIWFLIVQIFNIIVWLLSFLYETYLKSTPTPYQGDGRVQGVFKCPNCQNRWSSNSSWANTRQQCQKCHTNVYPYKQRPVQPREHTLVVREDKKHLSNLCEKCKQLGHNCVITTRVCQ